MMKRNLSLGIAIAITFIVNGQQNTWDFEFPKEKNNQLPLLDLSCLNEEFAGEHGFISTSSDGNSFTRGDGEAIRFWPVNSGGGDMSDEDLDRHARFLSQMGVNMARYHTAINPKGKGKGIYEADREEIDRIWRFVATMKKYGIYSTISPYWPHNGHSGGWLPEEWGIDGYSGKDDLWGVMYFNDRLQDAYKTWVKILYTELNPYTGIALKDEPAVGLIQIMNEDGVFFWTMQNMRPALKAMVVAKYRIWLKKKYGSVQDAFSAWRDARLPGDNPSSGMVDLYSIFDMTQPAYENKALRLSDQVEFYAKTQFDFYQSMHDYYKNVLGCKQLINAMNWTTADQGRLMDLERWTNTSCEVLALNRYYDPGHLGENSGWRIDPGHFYIGNSVLTHPERLPVNIKQVTGHPMIVTESGWNLPHKYMAEGPFLIAAMESLTGVDAYYWFSADAVKYREDPYFEFTRDKDGNRAMNRWTCSLPGMLGQFPANAFLYRMGYLKQGETMMHEEKPLDSLWNRSISPITEERNYDPNRDKVFIMPDDNISKLSPLAFLTGTIDVRYGGKSGKTEYNNKLNGLIDNQVKLIKSSTGEIEWDYNIGICTIDSEKAKGVCGFVGSKGKFSFKGMTLNTSNEYAAILVISLDNIVLENSKRILVQTGTKYLPTDWKEEEGDFEYEGNKLHGYIVINTGHMPWKADATKVRLELENPLIKKASLLDAGGFFVTRVDVGRTKGKLIIDLPPNAMYVLLEAE
jgi:hypothetical protein